MNEVEDLMKKVAKTAFLVFLLVLSLPAGLAVSEMDVKKDIVLVLDNSGSMRKNDPRSLTKKVVSGFLEGLPPVSRVGIVIFDEKATLAVPLSPMDTAETKQRLLASLDKVNYTGKWTDSPAGVERGVYELKTKGREDAAKVIVFLTDGIVETGDKARDLERSKWLREDLAGESRKLGIRIFGIAFTEEADFQLIQALGQGTGGGYFRALKADEIEGIFKEIEAALRKPAALPAGAQSAGGQGVGSWTIAAIGIIVLGIVAVAVGLSRRRAESGSGLTVEMPEATLYDIRAVTGKNEYPMCRPVLNIGRAETNDVVVAKGTVSSRHATIEYRNNTFHVVDQKSANGTFLNGERIEAEARLRHGDRIRFDEFEFTFLLAELADETKTQLRARPGSGTVPKEKSKASEGKGNEEIHTKLKDMCPLHPAWKATELCPVCKTAYCENCMRMEPDGRKVCVRCGEESRLT
jgi:pSer/pThr/pTyr-binding forkhead associated (FHA) protein/Mg-chelatase subunit ChlD